ncbi:hypothetical protein D3C79_878740 [compost metagenome]
MLVLHVRLASQVACEQQPRTNLLRIQVTQKIQALDPATIAQGERKTEPGRVTVGGGVRQDQLIGATTQTLAKPIEIALACSDEVIHPVHLRQCTGGLHVSDLEVVAQVRVGVLVIVALRQVTQLPAKTLAAGVVLARTAIAVAPPVTE